MSGRHVKLQGAMIKIWECLDQEILAEGPAGTAKTRTILEMLDFIARKYAKARILIVRKTRTSMTHSVMATFERFVQEADVHFHTTDQAYQYPNGSIIAVAGMDKPTKVLSSEWDIIYWNEATEGTENEWEILGTRLRGGVVPYQQQIADCNPDVENHWLNQRANTERMTRIVTRHEDNPLYWDAKRGEYTPEGERYVKGVLDKLTGVRLLRYRKGVWASREGLVYDLFDRAVHMIRREDLPRLRTYYRAIDFGFSNPFVCQWWGVDHDGRLYLLREMYYTQRTVKVHSEQIHAVTAGLPIAATITDHDAEDRATLWENGIETLPARKAIRPGIDAVMERLKVQGDGKPRLFIVEDALVELDQSLRERGLPTWTLDEFGSYAWPESKPDRNDKEVPVDAYNHGCLVGETLIQTPAGNKRLDAIQVGDLVMGRNGWVRVIDAAMTQIAAPIYMVKLANGVELRGTHDHPIWTESRGHIQLDALRYTDMVRYNVPRKEGALCLRGHSEKARRKSLSTKALSFVAIPKQKSGVIEPTSSRISCRGARALIGSIGNCTRISLGKFRKGMPSITRMAIHPITVSKTSNASQRKSISRYMARNLAMKGECNFENISFTMSSPKPSSGTSLTKDALGTLSTGKKYLATCRSSVTNASNAANGTRARNHQRLASVVTAASLHGGAPVALTTSGEPANGAANPMKSTGTVYGATVLVPVEAVFAMSERRPVYNLTVEGGEYYANGVLVHNCDALRYMVAHLDGDGSMANESLRDAFGWQG